MQMSLFGGTMPFKIDKPIRLIECFAGYGSQALALKYLGVEFEHWKICEWAVKSIQAYKDVHFANDNIDYSKYLTKEYLIKFLFEKGISSNYNEPMTYEQIKRLGEERIRQIYNNICATCNLVNIQQVRGKDLDIVEYDKYCYIMTYSFPCQDLSNAGLGKGMEKGSGTRSGMLWEIERILDECGNKPQVLLMENVPEVIGTNNIKHFAQWLEKLESLGYKCYWQVLNAKDYGVPQNRERCFMVSILGDYYYEFPEKQELKVRLKDLLEENVDEKFYLSDKALKGSINTQFSCSKLENKLPKDGIVPTICARDYKDPKCVAVDRPIKVGYIPYPNSDKEHQSNTVYSLDGLSPTIDTCNGGSRMPKFVVKPDNLKTKLCNDLIASGKVKENDFIRHSYSSNRMNKMYIQNKEFHDCSPTLDTRCDCLGVVVKDKEEDYNWVDRKVIKTIKNNGGEIPEFADLYNARPINDGVSGTLSTSCGNNCGCGSFAYIENYRIRKLTPRECGRLMGVRDEDIDKIEKNQSNSSQYHLFGDSIVVNVLMEIFRNIL